MIIKSIGLNFGTPIALQFANEQPTPVRERNTRKSANMKNMEKSGIGTFTGIILPSEWDAKGEIIRICLSSFDEQEYLLDFGDKDHELFSLIRKRVEIRGMLKKSDHPKTVKVEGYSIKEHDIVKNLQRKKESLTGRQSGG
jgi:hypothetical protein